MQALFKYTLNKQISWVFMLSQLVVVVSVQTIFSFINMNLKTQVYCKLKYNGLLRPLSLISLKGNDRAIVSVVSIAFIIFNAG